MKIAPVIQSEASPERTTIKSSLSRHLARRKYNRIQVAAAYATVAGARTMLDMCSHCPDTQSQWLLGLDDCVTQPGAIELLRSLDRSEVKVAALGGRPFRFHPKVYRFSTLRSQDELLMMGSANLTNTALVGNSESIVLLSPETDADRRIGRRIWRELWSQGHVPNDAELKAYRERYEKAKPLRREIEVLEQGPLPKASAELVIERDSTELDPSRAITCWIECGAITAMGRELELKAEQGLFFGLNPSASDEAFFKFRVSNGSMARLRMKYQGNHMWRLQMNNEVPEVRAGLRPRLPTGKLGRSEYVAVITRMAERGTYDLAFLHLDSQDFAELQTRSQELGTVGHTTATSSGRMYGWC